MNDDDIKALGLEARAFKARLKGKQKPSNDLLYLWFIGLAQLVRKRDVQLFDVWLRSEDGVKPYPSPNGLQHSVFPRGFYERDRASSVSSLSWMTYEVQPKLWALTVGGHLELKKKADKLPRFGSPEHGVK